MTAGELIAKLDAACLGRTPEQSLRLVSNEGRGFWVQPNGTAGKRYVSTHVDADLCGIADVIEAARTAAERDRLRRAIVEHRTAIHNAGTVRVDYRDEGAAEAKHRADKRLWDALEDDATTSEGDSRA